MSNKYCYATLIALIVIMVGCASTIPSLQRESAMFLEGNLAPDQIEISDVNRTAMNVTWRAKKPDGKIYNCFADDMLRKVKCVE